MRSFVATVLAVASVAQAAIFVTEPTASTICTANVPCNVRWNDDAQAPVLGLVGPSTVQLCTGGQFQQTCLQTISPGIDVSQNAFVTYNPDPSVGPTGAFYFIKFTSLNLPDPTNPQFKFTAFSARFTLNGMTGTFSPDVMAQVTGSGGIAAPTQTQPAVSSTPAVSQTRAAGNTVTVSTKATTSVKPTQSSGGALVTPPGVVSSVTGMTMVAGFFSVFMGGLLAFGL